MMLKLIAAFVSALVASPAHARLGDQRVNTSSFASDDAQLNDFMFKRTDSASLIPPTLSEYDEEEDGFEEADIDGLDLGEELIEENDAFDSNDDQPSRQFSSKHRRRFLPRRRRTDGKWHCTESFGCIGKAGYYCHSSKESSALLALKRCNSHCGSEDQLLWNYDGLSEYTCCEKNAIEKGGKCIYTADAGADLEGKTAGELYGCGNLCATSCTKFTVC